MPWEYQAPYLLSAIVNGKQGEFLAWFLVILLLIYPQSSLSSLVLV